MSDEYKTLSSRQIYQNRWLTLREDKIERASGAKGLYTVVEKPHFVVVIAIEGDSVYMVEQYRYPVGDRHLEFVQGACEGDNNITPAALAKLELREETGLTASQWEHVGFQYLAYGFCDQSYNIYIARDLTQGAQELEAEEEDLIVKKIKLSELERKILSGEIKDATTVNAFGLARMKGMI